jgi:hypothetical protein
MKPQLPQKFAPQDRSKLHLDGIIFHPGMGEPVYGASKLLS